MAIRCGGIGRHGLPDPSRPKGDSKGPTRGRQDSSNRRNRFSPDTCGFLLPVHPAAIAVRQSSGSSVRCLPFDPDHRGFVRAVGVSSSQTRGFVRAISGPLGRRPRVRFAEFQVPYRVHWLRFVTAADPASDAASCHFGRFGFVSRISKGPGSCLAANTTAVASFRTSALPSFAPVAGEIGPTHHYMQS
jgi:hypothetical protein